MTIDKGIFIQNIYYMLSYAFHILKQEDYQKVAGEKFDKIHDLFAAILEKSVARQVKQGLYREYVPMQEDLSVMRGKLNINYTISLKVQRKQKLSCEFDEFSEDNLYYQILKVTISDFTAIMQKAVMLAKKEKNDISAIHQLGEGWVAEGTLAIAVYCALKYQNDFDTALRVSVNHNGDSDSTGAVTGNILGAYLGYDAIPQKYKDNLELNELICEIAYDLFNDCRISEYGSYHDEV